jgi:hypothetical protein
MTIIDNEATTSSTGFRRVPTVKALLSRDAGNNYNIEYSLIM